MNDFWYRFLPWMLSLALSQFIYIKIDKRYEITNKLSLKLHIKHEWKACFCICCMLIFIFVVGIFGVYVIDISNILYSILCGIITGIGISISTKIQTNKNIPPS